MRIVMAGASGFLGTHLRRRLAPAGHEIVTLVRRPPRDSTEIQWAPQRHELDPAAVAGVDAVINLAGAGIRDRRWTTDYKKVLRSSRIDPTHTLATSMVAITAGERPAVWLNASGSDYYGDTAEATVDETSPAGTQFLAELGREWEAATQPASDAGVRVIALRTGFVLDRGGGLLKALLLPFRLGIGGKLGSGRQWMPVICLSDWLSAVTFVLGRPDIAGPVNLVGPHPVRNADFTKALGKALHRPAVAPIPRFALRILEGEIATVATASVRALPTVLTRAGFSFAHPDLDSTLRSALHSPKGAGR